MTRIQGDWTTTTPHPNGYGTPGGRSSRRLAAPQQTTNSNSNPGSPPGPPSVGRYQLDRRPPNFMIARWRWIVLVVLAVVAGAAAFSWSRTPTYRSAADVLVQPRVFAAGTAPQIPDMGSEAAVAGSSAVLDIAARMLNIPESELRGGVAVSVPLNTQILHISYTSSDAATAQARAQAIADAYVRYWAGQQPPLPLGRGLGTQPVLKSAVISDAGLPGSPASPKHNVDIAIAVLIGLALGIGTAYLRDRMDDRLRGMADLEQRSGEAVVAVVPPVRTLLWRRRAIVCDAGSRSALAYADLARRLLHVASQRTARSVLVTSPTGRMQSVASTNLAVALAETGRRVVLVHADLRRPAVGTGFDIDPQRSLAAVVDGNIGLSDALQDTSVPGLQVMPAGSPSSNAAATLHSTELRHVLRRLRSTADIVVIDGPPVLAGADVSTLADAADLLVLAADARRTTRAQVRATTDQLQPLQNKVFGWLLENSRRRFGLHRHPPGRREPARSTSAPKHEQTRPRAEYDGDVPTGADAEPANRRDVPASTRKR